MSLPKAIQRQADAADAFQKSLLDAQQDPQGETILNDPSQLGAPDPGGEPQQPAAPAPAPAPKPSDDWEQKYKSLQGVFNSQIPALQATAKAEKEQREKLAETVAELQRKLEASAQEPKPAAADPKDIESFGADLVDMVNRQAERVYASLVAQFDAQVKNFDSRLSSVEQVVTGVSKKTDSTLEQQFYAALSGRVPDFEKINGEQRWLDWLAETDSVYGVPRQAALDAAHRELDAVRVANVFNAYKAQFPAKPQASLSNQVAPSGAASPAPAAAPATNKQLLSSAFVAKFYNDLAVGRYRGRESEAQRLEAEINLAAAEGRIR